MKNTIIITLCLLECLVEGATNLQGVSYFINMKRQSTLFDNDIRAIGVKNYLKKN